MEGRQRSLKGTPKRRPIRSAWYHSSPQVVTKAREPSKACASHLSIFFSRKIGFKNSRFIAANEMKGKTTIELREWELPLQTGMSQISSPEMWRSVLDSVIILQFIQSRMFWNDNCAMLEGTRGSNASGNFGYNYTLRKFRSLFSHFNQKFTIALYQYDSHSQLVGLMCCLTLFILSG